ncbi:hypothetical protein K1T71_002407 [Dendrolimus kikuchii]|uniref:Uncharacterized protein n=1 Tax=Dendrolimus kikuchii TaxID=765133 RepID=A0ACC1DCY2_9NEOP|nr:hypothetical protein K1T71_002407 [Dendrolimus kikuchii]
MIWCDKSGGCRDGTAAARYVALPSGPGAEERHVARPPAARARPDRSPPSDGGRRLPPAAAAGPVSLDIFNDRSLFDEV